VPRWWRKWWKRNNTVITVPTGEVRLGPLQGDQLVVVPTGALRLVGQMVDRRIVVPTAKRPSPSAQAWSYVGIPYPTYSNASLTGLGYRSWPYDPCTIEPPAQPGAWPSAEAAGFYYIDNDHGSATDTANTYGYPDKPRLTLPEGAFTAGTVIEVHGGTTTPYLAVGDRFNYTGVGTASDQIWITSRGDVTKPQFAEFFHIGLGADAAHWVFDGLQLNNTRFDVRDPSTTMEYLTIRNCDFIGDGVSGGTSIQLNSVNAANGASNIMVYNCLCRDIDNWQSTVQRDRSFVSSGTDVSNLWIIDCTSYRTGGDGLLAGPSSNQVGGFIFVGGCDFYEHNENCIDIKEVHDVVLSGNLFHDIKSWGSQDPGNAVVAHSGGNGSGAEAQWVWCINNKIYDSGIGVQATQGADMHVIGNEFWGIDSTLTTGDVEGGYAFGHSGGDRCSFVNNTVYDCGGGMFVVSDNTDPEVMGNIFAARDPNKGQNGYGSYDLRSSTTNSYTTPPDYNLFDNRTVTGTFPANTDANSQIDVATGMTAPATQDFTLAAGSAAIDNGTKASVYATFASRYGFSIETDIAGNARPAASGDWDIGANEKI